MASVLINNETMLRTFVAIATLISVSLPAGAEIYKCRLPNGKTEISNVPCPTGSGTVVARPDEPVSESSRRAAEQDVERMRNYVEKREAAQRADEAALRDEQRAASQQSRNSAQRPAQQYGNAQECLRNVEQMVLEASQRAMMEADCRTLVSPQPPYPSAGVPVYVPVAVPVYPHRHHEHPKPAPAPKTKSTSGQPIAVQPQKK